MSSARSSTASARSASRSTPRITAGASAISPSATRPPAAAASPAAHSRWSSTGRTIDRIKKQYKIPLIIKGIATAEDAKLAVEHGVEWIYISNHGGRQLDHGRGSMDVLPEVVDAVAGRAKIMIDGGFYRGSDMVKAIALGADLVGMGRMQCYALAAGGAAGVVRMLEILEDEVQRSLGLLGVNTFADLNKNYLHLNAPVVTVPSVFSAFPLATIDPWRY